MTKEIATKRCRLISVKKKLLFFLSKAIDSLNKAILAKFSFSIDLN